MTTDPLQLATKIGKYIAKNHPVTYETLAERAVTHGVPDHIFYQAIERIQRNKNISAKAKGDTIVYTVAVPKAPSTAISHLEWIRDNYPVMDSSNDGSGIEADYSFLFLSPEELNKYKAQLRGVAYIPKKRYVQR
jgi:hypothetical protein